MRLGMPRICACACAYLTSVNQVLGRFCSDLFFYSIRLRTFQIVLNIQLNPATSNLFVSKSSLFRTNARSPWFCPTFLSHFTSFISNLDYAEYPAFSKYFGFP